MGALEKLHRLVFSAVLLVIWIFAGLIIAMVALISPNNWRWADYIGYHKEKPKEPPQSSTTRR
jgi:hypothetical protein